MNNIDQARFIWLILLIVIILLFFIEYLIDFIE